jgi:ribosomal protein S27AE
MSVRSNTLEPDAMSAIVNCLCPECGGVIELETNRLECLRCGKLWRQVWERIRLRRASKVKPLSPTRS